MKFLVQKLNLSIYPGSAQQKCNLKKAFDDLKRILQCFRNVFVIQQKDGRHKEYCKNKWILVGIILLLMNLPESVDIDWDFVWTDRNSNTKIFKILQSILERAWTWSH